MNNLGNLHGIYAGLAAAGLRDFPSGEFKGAAGLLESILGLLIGLGVVEDAASCDLFVSGYGGHGTFNDSGLWLFSMGCLVQVQPELTLQDARFNVYRVRDLVLTRVEVDGFRSSDNNSTVHANSLTATIGTVDKSDALRLESKGANSTHLSRLIAKYFYMK